MGVLRRIKRNQLNKQRKEVKRQFNQMVKTLNGMQKSCVTCGAEFDNKNPEHLDSWHVNVYKDKVELYCNKCYTTTATEISENVNEPETVR
jgi:hypothetical protein